MGIEWRSCLPKNPGSLKGLVEKIKGQYDLGVKEGREAALAHLTMFGEEEFKPYEIHSEIRSSLFAGFVDGYNRVVEEKQEERRE